MMSIFQFVHKYDELLEFIVNGLHNYYDDGAVWHFFILEASCNSSFI